MLHQLMELQVLQGPAVASIVCICLVLYRWKGRQLDHIPAIGFSSHLMSFIGAAEFLFNAPGVIQRGCDQYRHSIFKVPNFMQWTVVVSGTKFIDELRKAPEDVLSFSKAVDEELQTPYTLGPSISENPYHIPIIRSHLISNLAAICTPLHEEVAAACSSVIKVQDHEWSAFRAMKTLMPIICRASNRIFVGAPLCQEPGFLDINIQFTITVVKVAGILKLFPSFLRPIAGYFLGRSASTSIDRAVEYLEPIIEERKRMIEENGKDYPGKPNDMLAWLMDEATDEEALPRNLTRRILTVNFAAIHTSTMTLLHALYYLAANPEYAQPMREEIQETVGELGWTHAAVQRFTKVDSFIKESQRLNALGCLLMGRVARQPFTFSDGTYIPEGTYLSVPVQATHLDDTNYTDPYIFSPFRFANTMDGQTKARKLDMATTHADFVAFGHGRHACPGRYFATEMLKLTLAHIIMSYDLKLEGEHPPNTWVLSTCIPSTTAEVLFRKRQE